MGLTGATALREASQSIEHMLRLIIDMASRTNMLALNAGIEANNAFSDAVDTAVDGQSATTLLIASYVEQAVAAGKEIDTRVHQIGRGAAAVGQEAVALGELSSGLTRAARSLHQRASQFVETVAAA